MLTISKRYCQYPYLKVWKRGNIYAKIGVMEKHEYTLKRSERKSLAIAIESGGKVLVKAPVWLPEYRIELFLQEKSQWIAVKKAEVLRMEETKPAHTYESGDVFWLEGQEYRLRVCSGAGLVSVNREKREILAECQSCSPKAVQKILEEFYRKEAENRCSKLVRHRLLVLEEKAGDSLFVKPGRITIRSQKTRWGSCSSKGNLNFNWRLIMAPGEVLDYVVVHELCHLVYMNHSAMFWKLVEEILPDYRKQRQWLKENGRMLEWEELV